MDLLGIVLRIFYLDSMSVWFGGIWWCDIIDWTVYHCIGLFLHVYYTAIVPLYRHVHWILFQREFKFQLRLHVCAIYINIYLNDFLGGVNADDEDMHSFSKYCLPGYWVLWFLGAKLEYRKTMCQIFRVYQMVRGFFHLQIVWFWLSNPWTIAWMAGMLGLIERECSDGGSGSREIEPQYCAHTCIWNWLYGCHREKNGTRKKHSRDM